MKYAREREIKRDEEDEKSDRGIEKESERRGEEEMENRGWGEVR